MRETGLSTPSVRPPSLKEGPAFKNQLAESFLTAGFLRSTGYNGVFSGICVVQAVLRSYLIML